MPKKLVADIYSGYNEMMDNTLDPAVQQPNPTPEAQPGDEIAAAAPAEAEAGAV